MSTAKVFDPRMSIIEFKHVKSLNRGYFMRLNHSGPKRVIKNIGTTCLLGLLDIVLHDHGAILIPKIPWNQTGSIHRGEVNTSVISVPSNFLPRDEKKIIPDFAR